ncbi:MAG: substrate-binding domain-containing protein, partial [Anaerolineae bacterium]|nr:substrate-binding domain-containing protein [Anaerolineae bacterium]
AALISDMDGIIMASPYPRATVDRVADASRCPVVLVDNMFPASPYDAIMADDYSGGYQITRHLIELGHTQIKMVMGHTINPVIAPSFLERYRGYSAACQEVGLTPLAPGIVPREIDDSRSATRDDMFRGWMAGVLNDHSRITAFFGVSDNYAFWVMRTLQSMGYHIPQQFSVAGYDDYEMAGLINPPLTTIHSYKLKLGRVAVRQLMQRIAGDDTPPLLISVGVNMVIRSSTAAPALW